MLRVLRDKFLRLGRDEDGVALVTTLAVFMFMYLICMGVYAIGTAVKTRIHLQNACDAAAYSAAVVQADTLSRIATINRAMAWTYITMTRRQMDYIVYKWLEKACRDYDIDHDHAEKIWNESTSRCPLIGAGALGHDIPGRGWFIGGDGVHETINLNDSHYPFEAYVKDRLDVFDSNWMNSPDVQRKSFYAFESGSINFDRLGDQIDKDKNTIGAMNSALCYLARSLPEEVETTVNDIIEANMPPEIKDRCLPPQIFQSEKPLKFDSDQEGYLDYLVQISDSDQELRFLSYADQSSTSVASVFETGIDTWFVRSSSDTGFKRVYEQKDRVLVAKWHWWTYAWDCVEVDDVWTHPFHKHEDGDGVIKAKDCYDSRYDGITAEPLALTSDFFGKNGTITVGLAIRNDNPWEPVLRLVRSWRNGIFSAFSIGLNLPLTPQYTVCLASAKAGWKETLNWSNAEGVENDRAYRVDWEDGDWNLCQSDLDAVLIPVRRAETLAEGRCWNGDVGDFLADYVEENGLGVSRNDMLSGGSKRMTLAQWHDDRGSNLPPDYYRFDRWRGLPDGRTWDWVRGNVTTEWQIGNKSQPIDWDGLQKVMFH